jgi:hypothetical protein
MSTISKSLFSLSISPSVEDLAEQQQHKIKSQHEVILVTSQKKEASAICEKITRLVT